MYAHPKDSGYWKARALKAEAENERLSEQVNEMSGTFTTKESVLKDAERYRWLRQHRVRVFVNDRDGYSCLLFDHETPELLDAAIDAATNNGETA